MYIFIVPEIYIIYERAELMAFGKKTELIYCYDLFTFSIYQ